MVYNQQKIKSYEHWTLFLHESQYYLGRTYLWANRSDAVNLVETSQMERDELFYIMDSLKRTLDDLFQPDLYNYASLGNVSNHLHMHVIPRYSVSKTFDGLEFIDKRWGMNYSPYDETFDIGESRFLDLKNTLSDKLSKFEKGKTNDPR